MGLESGTFINDFNTANPAGGDLRLQGDDHLRLVKTLIKNSFPNIVFARYIEQARADVADSATPALWAATTDYANLLGATAITGFASGTSGQRKLIRIDANRTLTHNATTLQLPGSVNIAALAGDHMIVQNRGTTSNVVIAYFRANGKPLESQYAADSYVYGTGAGTTTTGTITAFGRSLVDDADAAAGRATLGALSDLVPTIQRILSGAGNYTPTAGTKWIRVRMVGGGGGGGARVTNNGTDGGTTSFGAWTAIRGTGGAAASGTGGGRGVGGSGGVNGTGTLITRFSGQDGDVGGAFAATIPARGGSSLFGGGGAASGHNGAGQDAKANTGSGGSGGSGNGSSSDVGAGGGAGEYVEFYVSAPGVIAYSVGAAGVGGAAGSNAGGNGAAGIIIIEEFK